MIEIGKSMTRQIVIDDSRAISFMGPDLRVYGTPSVLSDIEMASRDLLLTMLEPGQDSVGTHVDLSHLEAAVLGAQVEITVTIADAAKRRVTFEAAVDSASRRIATAKHDRMIVSVADLKARIASLA
jgi:predicted thioesterase